MSKLPQYPYKENKTETLNEKLEQDYEKHSKELLVLFDEHIKNFKFFLRELRLLDNIIEVPFGSEKVRGKIYDVIINNELGNVNFDFVPQLVVLVTIFSEHNSVPNSLLAFSANSTDFERDFKLSLLNQ